MDGQICKTTISLRVLCSRLVMRWPNGSPLLVAPWIESSPGIFVFVMAFLMLIHTANLIVMRFTTRGKPEIHHESNAKTVDMEACEKTAETKKVVVESLNEPNEVAIDKGLSTDEVDKAEPTDKVDNEVSAEPKPSEDKA